MPLQDLLDLLPAEMFSNNAAEDEDLRSADQKVNFCSFKVLIMIFKAFMTLTTVTRIQQTVPSGSLA